MAQTHCDFQFGLDQIKIFIYDGYDLNTSRVAKKTRTYGYLQIKFVMGTEPVVK